MSDERIYCEHCDRTKQYEDMFNIYRQICQKCHDEGLKEYRDYNHLILGDWLGRFDHESEEEQS